MLYLLPRLTVAASLCLGNHCQTPRGLLPPAMACAGPSGAPQGSTRQLYTERVLHANGADTGIRCDMPATCQPGGTVLQRPAVPATLPFPGPFVTVLVLLLLLCLCMLLFRIMHLNKPDTLNSLTVTMASEFSAALQQLQHDAAARALVLTGMTALGMSCRALAPFQLMHLRSMHLRASTRGPHHVHTPDIAAAVCMPPLQGTRQVCTMLEQTAVPLTPATDIASACGRNDCNINVFLWLLLCLVCQVLVTVLSVQGVILISSRSAWPVT